jgi:hypothetical protein
VGVCGLGGGGEGALTSSLQVWFISPQRKIISAVRFWFLKSYSLLDAVNPISVNFKDQDAA